MRTKERGLTVSYEYKLEWWHGTLRWCGDGIELALCEGVGGPAESIEIIRRLLGVAQLPLSVDAATSNRWLTDARALVLATGSRAS